MKVIKDFINSLEDWAKPLFIFVIIFGAIYSILAILACPIWFIVWRSPLGSIFERKNNK